MNILGGNLRSLLSVTDGPDLLQQGSAGASGVQGDFASSFMEQLGLLQNGQNKLDVSAMQGLVDAAKNGDIPPSLQNFAAFLGHDISANNKLSRDIDLDDTLQTLADIMQQLQQLELNGDASAIPVLDGGAAIQEKMATNIDPNAEVAAEVIAVPAGVSQSPVLAVAEDSEKPSEVSLSILGNGKPFSAQNIENRNQSQVLDPNAGRADDLGTDFSRSIASMLAKGDAEGQPQQDKANPGFNADDLLSRLDSSADKDASGKSLPGVAADIVKLNQAVRGDTATLPNAQPSMNRPFGDPAWNQELSDKLIWMHKQAIPSAELRLNPEHLGPLQVKIDVNGDQTSVAFTAQHPAVKEAIEAAIPKLREMLSGQQLNLADVNVSQQQADQRQSPRDFFQMAGGQGHNQDADSDSIANAALNESQNLVDEIEAGRAVATNGLLSIFA